MHAELCKPTAVSLGLNLHPLHLYILHMWTCGSEYQQTLWAPKWAFRKAFSGNNKPQVICKSASPPKIWLGGGYRFAHLLHLLFLCNLKCIVKLNSQLITFVLASTSASREPQWTTSAILLTALAGKVFVCLFCFWLFHVYAFTWHPTQLFLLFLSIILSILFLKNLQPATAQTH